MNIKFKKTAKEQQNKQYTWQKYKAKIRIKIKKLNITETIFIEYINNRLT